MERKLTNSKEIYKEAIEYIPGGVNSPVRAFQSVNKEFPIFIKKAKGSKLYDEDNNEYVDMINSWGAMILGHCQEEVEKSVFSAIKNGTSYGLPTKSEVELAKLITKIYKNIDKVRLTTSGTEATMSAIRLARAYTKRNKIVKFDGCYHGHSDSLLVKAGSGLLTYEYQDSNGITDGTIKDTITLPYGDVDALEKLFEQEKDIACVIIEPIAANMGVVTLSKDVISKLRDITLKNGTLLIFDEVITGFRVSIGGAAEYYGISPDIVTFGKIIGGGFPVGAFGASNEIMNLLSPVGNVYHAGTLSGNPISVAAGLTTLNILNENTCIYEQIQEKTRDIVEYIEQLIKKMDICAVVNYVNGLYTIFFGTDSVKNLNDAINTYDKCYEIYFTVMLQNGIIVPPSKYEAHFISAAHTNEDIEKIKEATAEAFRQIKNEFKIK